MNSRRDTDRQRNRQASRPLSVALRVFAGFPRLYKYRLDLPPGPLYGLDAHQEARALVNRTVGSAPAYWKLEGVPGERRHIHLTTPLPPVAVPAALHAASVYDLRGALAYDSKPGDPRLCLASCLTPWTPDPYTRSRNYRAALDEYGEARRVALTQGKRRLSPLSGWVNAPASRSTPASPVLVFQIARYLLAWTLAAAQNGDTLPGVHPIPSRPLPDPYDRCRAALMAHPPPRIGQVQAQ
jgi:hypothetical protein